MGFFKEKPWYAAGNSQRVTSACFASIAIIAVVDAVLLPPIALGLLYLVPLAVAAAFASRLQIIFLVAICAAFWEAFSNLPAGPERIVRLAFIFFSYGFVMLLIHSIAVYRRAATSRLKDFENDISALQQSQQRLNLLLNATPVAILTVGSDGSVAHCNHFAHDLLGVGLGGLQGQSITTFVPEFEQLRNPANGGKFRSRLRQANGAAFDAIVRVVADRSSGYTVIVAERAESPA